MVTMRRVNRFDQGSMGEVRITPQGFLLVPARITKTGVFKYKRPDGKIMIELRHPEDVFDSASMATLRGVPTTLEHPKVDGGLLSPETVKAHMRGYLSGEVIRDGEYLASELQIMDEEAIAAAKNGKAVEVSCGYSCDLEESEGEYEGQKYTHRQRNIVYNHVAQTRAGRLGPDVRILRTDSDDAINVTDNQQGDPEMKKIMIDGKEFDCSPELAAAYEAQQSKMQADAKVALDAAAEKQKAAEGKVLETEKKMDSVTAELDETKEKLAAEKKARTDSQDLAVSQAAVDERIRVLSVAKHVITDSKEEDLKKKSNAELIKDVVKKRSSVDVEGKSEHYLAARFDSISETIEEEIKEQAEVRKAFGNRFDSKDGVSDSKEAFKRQQERTKNGGASK